MEIKFYKYHGTGNDFIIIDNRQKKIAFNSTKEISQFCDRRFGIGADGLILLENSDKGDFKMIYYNADGNEGSMCGNGGRCIVAFATSKGIINKSTRFEAIDGMHEATILDFNNDITLVSLKMQDVIDFEINDHHYILNTGSPHYVIYSDTIDNIDIVSEGKKIRYNKRFKADGINVNYISGDAGVLKIKTYERGVEDETWSCGTGSVAAALVLELEGKAKKDLPVEIISKGGNLKVSYKRNGHTFSDIHLIGPAELVYEGSIIKNTQ